LPHSQHEWLDPDPQAAIPWELYSEAHMAFAFVRTPAAYCPLHLDCIEDFELQPLKQTREEARSNSSLESVEQKLRSLEVIDKATDPRMVCRR